MQIVKMVMNEKYILLKKAYKEITQNALLQYPNEACGLLSSKWSDHVVENALCAGNRADKENKGSYYKIDPIELFEMEQDIEKEGYEVIGFFHSHPDKQAVLSEEDYKNMIPGMVYIIASITKNIVHELRGYVKNMPEGYVSEIRIEEESLL